MRLLLVHPGAELYGSDRVLLETAAALIDSGVDAFVALPSPGPLADALRRVGCRVAVLPTFVLRKSLLTPAGIVSLPLRAVVALARSWRVLRRLRPDALYVSTITLPMWLAAGRLSRTPTVAHVHEAERDVGRLVRRGLYFPLRLAGTVVANSEFTREVIGSTDASTARRAKVVHNGVAGPQTVIEPRQDAADGPRLVYIGRLSPRKGTDLVIEATAELRRRGIPARAAIVGDVYEGYEWYRDELKQSSCRLGVTDAVSFSGFRQDIWPELAANDILVVPSRLEESFGNAAVEGLLAGRAVIASDRPGLREATAGSGAILVPIDDATAIADAAEGLWRNWPAARTRAMTDADRAADTYSPSRYRTRIAEVLLAAARTRR